LLRTFDYWLEFGFGSFHLMPLLQVWICDEMLMAIERHNGWYQPRPKAVGWMPKLGPRIWIWPVQEFLDPDPRRGDSVSCS
jgi:hypothetical protein